MGRGVSGQTTPQMLLRFRQDVVALRPNVVVILAGTNDIAGNTGPSSLEMIEDNIASMVEIARANGIRVVLASVLPVADYPWKPGLEPAPKVVALNAWLRTFAGRPHSHWSTSRLWRHWLSKTPPPSPRQVARQPPLW